MSITAIQHHIEIGSKISINNIPKSKRLKILSILEARGMHVSSTLKTVPIESLQVNYVYNNSVT